MALALFRLERRRQRGSEAVRAFLNGKPVGNLQNNKLIVRQLNEGVRRRIRVHLWRHSMAKVCPSTATAAVCPLLAGEPQIISRAELALRRKSWGYVCRRRVFGLDTHSACCCSWWMDKFLRNRFKTANRIGLCASRMNALFDSPVAGHWLTSCSYVALLLGGTTSVTMIS